MSDEKLNLDMLAQKPNHQVLGYYLKDKWVSVMVVNYVEWWDLIRIAIFNYNIKAFKIRQLQAEVDKLREQRNEEVNDQPNGRFSHYSRASWIEKLDKEVQQSVERIK